MRLCVLAVLAVTARALPRSLLLSLEDVENAVRKRARICVGFLFWALSCTLPEFQTIAHHDCTKTTLRAMRSHAFPAGITRSRIL